MGNLNNIADISTQISKKLCDKNDDTFQKCFTKEQVISSVIQTLFSKFKHIRIMRKLNYIKNWTRLLENHQKISVVVDIL